MPENELKMPTSAFLAVTLLCNSRCVMCDIWKNKGLDYLPIETYKKLPKTLDMIDITGGEPFLRPDIPEIVQALKETNPQARVLITTHGFMTDKMESQIDGILKAAPNIAIRVSLDGIGKMHDDVRGIPQAFEKVEATLKMLKQKGVKDLGVNFTLMDQNKHHFRQVYNYSKRNHLKFSMGVLHDSPVYFGEGKRKLSPNAADVRQDFDFLYWEELKNIDPRSWAKAWFDRQAYFYMTSHKRPYACGAGENFFYMDSHANIYMCHYKDWPIGNLNQSSFDEIWRSAAKMNYLPQAKACNDCWMICTAKDAIIENKWKILTEIPKLAMDILKNKKAA